MSTHRGSIPDNPGTGSEALSSKPEMPVLQGTPSKACYKHTCIIQRCLRESNYDSKSCAWAVAALKKCCEMPHAVGSVHCAFSDVHGKKSLEEEKRS